jgi:alpha-L-rhamnosidase
MIACGSTMTLEAWDFKYKNNLDWNHAWGAAPANIISRYLLGVRPLAPGCRRMLIQPRLGGLAWVQAKIPTPLGPIELRIENGERVNLDLSLPAGMEARVEHPGDAEKRS